MTGLPAITCRRLGAEDLPLLLGAGAVFDHPVRPDQARAFLDDPQHEVVLARAGDVVLAKITATVLLHPDKPPQMFINEVDVDPDWQNRGIGAMLVARMLDIAADRGCAGTWLATEAGNAPARALYRKCGGAETGGVVLYEWPEAGAPSMPSEQDDVPLGPA